MRKRLTTALTLTLVALPLMAQTSQAPRPGGGEQAMDDPIPMLTVSGSGEARVDPDLATVRLGVTAQAATARAAQEQVNRAAAGVLEAIRALDIKDENIQTSGLSLSPLYSQDRPEGGEIRAPRITGYQASNSVTVRIEDLTKVGPVIDAGLSAGANTLDGVEFGLRNDEAARAQALADAAGKARAKAQTLARALGLTLGNILEVTEGGVAVLPQPYPRYGRAVAELSVAADTPVSAGQVGVQASVTIRYRISQ